jgi:hypothetical protein
MMNRQSTRHAEHAEAWRESMHKEVSDYKYAEERRDECCCCYEGLRCEEGRELSSRNAQKGEWCIEWTWRTEHKKKKNRKHKHVGAGRQ